GVHGAHPAITAGGGVDQAPEVHSKYKEKEMKNKRTLTIASILFALAAIAAFAIFRYTPGVHAQEPPPDRVRTAFSMLGIVHGQTMRFTVSNTIMPNDPNYPPDPCQVVLNFRNANGNLVRDARGEIIRREQTLETG